MLLVRCLARASGSTWFRIPPALSSILAALGTLKLRVVGILDHVDPLVSSSNHYVVYYTVRDSASLPLVGLGGLCPKTALLCYAAMPAGSSIMLNPEAYYAGNMPIVFL